MRLPLNELSGDWFLSIIPAGGLVSVATPDRGFGIDGFPMLSVRRGCGLRFSFFADRGVVSLFRLHLRTLAPLRVNACSPSGEKMRGLYLILTRSGCVGRVEYFCIHLLIKNVELALQKICGVLLPCVQACKSAKHFVFQ